MKKHGQFKLLFLSTILLSTTSSLSLAIEHSQEDEHGHNDSKCGSTPPPLLSVADYNGDGIVDQSDMKKIIQIVKSKTYYTLYDRNSDSKINSKDIALTAKDLGKESNFTDQQLAQYYDEVKILQLVKSAEELYMLGFEPITGSLAGHGVHWNNVASDLPVSGVNVPEDGSSVKGIYFSKNAIPLFKDSNSDTGLSTLDYPQFDGAWMYERVQAFDGFAPVYFPDSVDESWHTHAGLCITLQDDGAATRFQLDQHMSYMECQSLPSLRKIIVDGQEINAWFNIWMLHAWLFDLNPEGVFGNTHPCLDPHAPEESEINGEREVPEFFRHH